MSSEERAARISVARCLYPPARASASTRSCLRSAPAGEVYGARDTKLDRAVAIKILPEAFAADTERSARFQREAKTLASLNHPNIAHIHGLEESDGVRALVMELVEGEDLSERIARGVIPVAEASPVTPFGSWELVFGS